MLALLRPPAVLGVRHGRSWASLSESGSAAPALQKGESTNSGHAPFYFVVVMLPARRPTF
jgi:hypothetical protein